MLACISLKEKKEKCFCRCKKKRVVVLPPFYIYSYIGISSSAFLTIIPFSKKIKNLFLSFFLSGRAPGIHDYTWLNSIRFKGLRRHCPTLIIRDGQPALDADCYLRNGLMPARSSKWKDNKRLFFFCFFFLLQSCWQDSNYWTGKMDGRGVCFSFFSPQPISDGFDRQDCNHRNKRTSKLTFGWERRED